MKKIAFFIHNFNGGGAERVTIKLANELADLGYHVSIIVINNTGELKKLISNKVKIDDLDIRNKSKIMKNLKNIYYLKNRIEKQKIDILFSVTTHMNLIASISNCMSRKRIILYSTIHNSISMEKNSFKSVRNKLLKQFDKYITKNIVVSNEAEIDYIKTLGINKNRTMTIYNPVVSDEILKLQLENPNHKWIKQDRDYKIVLAVGRLTEQKNYNLLLKSIRNVSEKVNVKLIILGEGELKEELLSLSKSLKIEDIVDFYGFTHNVYPFFANCDLYTLSSNWEGLPTVLIEALACGCNIVSTACPSGPSEILNYGEFGTLVPINDVDKFTEAIINSLSKEKKREKQINQAFNFSVNKSIQEYLKLIEG